MKTLNKLIKSRVVWIGLTLLFEMCLIGLFSYVVVVSFKEFYNLTALQIVIILGIILYVISFFVIVYIINSRTKPAYKLAWLVVVAIIPFFGCFFYLLFGNKKITARQKRRMKPIFDMLDRTKIDRSIEKKLDEENPDAIKIAEYITNASGAALYKNTDITYYPSGEDVFPVMLEELKKAKSFIFIEYFIISPGLFWGSILEILKEKVKEGVDVRVIYDDVGSAKNTPYYYDRYLRSLGIQCISFHKFKPLLDVKINNRDHRKIMVIDGKVGFSGGINLADEYINKVKLFGYFKDNAIKLVGEGVHGLTALFLTQWLSISNVDITKEDLLNAENLKYFPDNTSVKGSGYVQPYGDLPYNYESVGERVYLNLLTRANKYCYITTPYLILDDELVNALCGAAKQGVDVRIITPHIPDKKMVFKVTRSYYNHLLTNGVKIYEYTPGFIHMKMFIVDDIFGTVGTINLDYRSLYLHCENATFMYKTDCIKDMKKDYLETMAASQEITLKRYKEYASFRRISWAILRLFAPLI